MDRLLDDLMDLAHDERSDGSQARHAAKRMLLDSVGCAIGASQYEVPTIARTLATRYPHPAGTHVLGVRGRFTAERAAFANGVMIRYLDLNDAYGSAVGIGHPSDYIPAVLAAADLTACDGVTVLDAIALSYEVFCRLTDVLRLGVQSWDHVINGAVATAVGAGYVFQLTPDELRNAIALALVPNVALQVTRLNSVSKWKGCASANAIRNGLFAVELAQAGMTGPGLPFEGRGGLFEAIGSTPAFDNWGRQHSAILDCNIKRYPAGYFSQSAIQAALEIRHRLGDSSRITKVEVGTFAFGLHVMAGDTDKWAPTTRETADHSLPYVVAHALAHGYVTKDSFTPEALTDPETRRLLKQLTVTQDEECESQWPEACMNSVTVHLSDGTQLTSRIRDYLGHNANPLSDSGLEAKFSGLVVPALGPEQARRLAGRIWSLSSAKNLDQFFASTLAPGTTETTGAAHSGGQDEPAEL